MKFNTKKYIFLMICALFCQIPFLFIIIFDKEQYGKIIFQKNDLILEFGDILILCIAAIGTMLFFIWRKKFRRHPDAN